MIYTYFPPPGQAIRASLGWSGATWAKEGGNEHLRFAQGYIRPVSLFWAIKGDVGSHIPTSCNHEICKGFDRYLSGTSVYLIGNELHLYFEHMAEEVGVCGKKNFEGTPSVKTIIFQTDSNIPK